MIYIAMSEIITTLPFKFLHITAIESLIIYIGRVANRDMEAMKDIYLDNYWL